ncbi:MAG: PfkB family carbohydrate kinase [Candidatus Poribacteria bacterium]
MSVLIVGSVAFDSIETATGSDPRALGGSATYGSLAAGFFSPVNLVGVVGQDFGQENIDLLASRGVDLEGLERKPGKTFFWAGKYSADFSERETLATDLNVFADFQPHIPESYRDSRYIFLANIAPNLQQMVLEQTTDPSLVVADTMNLWIDIQKGDLMELLKSVDVFVLNDEEARMLTGETNLISAGRRLLTYGPSRAIIKKGEHGAVSLTEDSYFSAPAYPTQDVVDPTGAGDTFAGALMGYLAAHDSASEEVIRRGIVLGSVVASFTVEGFGLDRLREIDQAAIEQRYRELRSYCTVE